MRENFEKAISFVFKWEGGYTNDPKDPGGETKFGISKRYHPNLDIKNLTIAQAKQIYLDKYWLPFKCDTLPYPQDIIVFDIAINPGTKLVGLLRGDWKDYLFQRIGYYRELVRKVPYKRIYYDGWVNRTLDLYGLVSR